MARIRTIKPEFWTDEKLSSLPPIHRLVFLGLMSALADDFGRLLDNQKIIDAAIFPDSNDTTAESLAALETLGRIKRGTTASGQKIIQIVNWEKHQRVDKRNSKQALPPIFDGLDDSPLIRECVANDSRMCRENVANESRTIRESVANESRTIPPTTDLVPTTYDHRPPTFDWGMVEEMIFRFGVTDAPGCVNAAREKGSTPDRLAQLMEHWQGLLAENPTRWRSKAGVLHHRIKIDRPDCEVTEHWPPPDEATQQKEAKSKQRKINDQARNEFTDKNLEAEKEQLRLAARYGDQWEQFSEPDRLTIAEILLGSRLKMIRNKWALMRDEVFSEADKRKVAQLADLLKFSGGNAA